MKEDKRKNNGGHKTAGRKKKAELDKKRNLTIRVRNSDIYRVLGEKVPEIATKQEIDKKLNTFRSKVYELIEKNIENN